MPEKRERRRYDLRPQNRPDVKAGVKKAHLDMQGRLISGTLATGQKAHRNQQGDVVVEEGEQKGFAGLGGDKGREIERKDVSLEGFYKGNPSLTQSKFDPAQASGRKSVKRRLKAKREAETAKKAAAAAAAKKKPPPPPKIGVPLIPDDAPDNLNAPGAPAPAPGAGRKGGVLGPGKGGEGLGEGKGGRGLGPGKGGEGLGKPPAADQPPADAPAAAPEPEKTPEPDPVPDLTADPNAAGGGGGGDPVQGAQPGLNPLTAGEGPSRQGARDRERLAGTGPQSRILKNEQGIQKATDQLAAVQLKEVELNKAMEEQKRRQNNMSRRRNTVQKGPQMDPKTGR